MARFYDPVIAHFIQADSIIPTAGNTRGFDRYAYVMNNPVNFNDPSGHICKINNSEYGTCTPNDPGFREVTYSPATVKQIPTPSNQQKVPLSLPSATPTPKPTAFNYPTSENNSSTLPIVSIITTPMPTALGTPYPRKDYSKLARMIEEDISITYNGVIDFAESYSLYPSTDPTNPFSIGLIPPGAGGGDFPTGLSWPCDTYNHCLTTIATSIDAAKVRSESFMTLISPINVDDGFDFSDWVAAYSADVYWFGQ